MRTLRFIVKGQIIEPDPTCDFSNLVPGSSGYLQAEFSFSSDWDGFVKGAVFWNMMGRQYKKVDILKDGKTCIIPEDALKRVAFKVQILGISGDKKILTNKLVVRQNGGNK